MNDETLKRLRPIVATYAQNKEALETITEDTDFIRDLKINSANLVDVVLDIEEEFDIEIDNDSMEQMLNVRVALQVIEAKLQQK
ncbi:phosphopantetheine-binding protein [Pedobacter sp. MC2016-14]|uniref:phosphopantetheine-binding protein n=1 Tax=Pedobacter sp. MC2016-14 TaxID=2897327 RepID=UPI001E37B29B|nr:phosphopantetheine-binding protein [Pedobacter sp. MC2016-14]MCD0490637.1 phosphopantetheine-binding protein [Pedobacter sp. MC2016-14]